MRDTTVLPAFPIHLVYILSMHRASEGVAGRGDIWTNFASQQLCEYYYSQCPDNPPSGHPTLLNLPHYTSSGTWRLAAQHSQLILVCFIWHNHSQTEGIGIGYNWNWFRITGSKPVPIVPDSGTEYVFLVVVVLTARLSCPHTHSPPCCLKDPLY